MTAKARYRAFFTDNGQEIYHRQPAGNLVGMLPLGAKPKSQAECGTLDRRDGGDPFERAIFAAASGREIVIEKMV